MNSINKIQLMDIFKEIKEKMLNEKEYLIDLDSVIGDGDLGLTMSKGFTEICDNFINLKGEEKLGNFLMKTGFCMANAVPSTMGTLVATAIMKSGSSLKEKEVIEASDILNMFKDAIKGVEKRGKSVRGEKTLLDALYPAMESVEKAMTNSNIKNIAGYAYEGAKKGVEETKNMQSVHGKAACFGEKSIGIQDPGATVVMFILEGVYNYFNNNN